jgi:hypothetical protein
MQKITVLACNEGFDLSIKIRGNFQCHKFCVPQDVTNSFFYSYFKT